MTTSPRDLGAATEPAPRLVRTGDVGEPTEALLVTVRGGLVASARRASTGSVSFEIDDGSGALRISVDAALALDDDHLRVRGMGRGAGRGRPGDERRAAAPRLPDLAARRVRPADRGIADRWDDRRPAARSGAGAVGGASGRSNLGDLDTVGQPGAGDLVRRGDPRRRSVAGARDRRAAVGRGAARRRRGR